MNASWIDTTRLSRWPHGRAERWAVKSRPGVQYVELEKARVRVRLAGEGRSTIVFVPDPPNVIEHYDRLFELLTPSTRVLCIEAPGLGFSWPKAGYDFSLEQQVKTMAAVLQRLAVGPYVLAFSCAAVFVALKLAVEYPDLVEKVVMIQAPSWAEELLWSRRLEAKTMLAWPVVGQLTFPPQKRVVSRGWYHVALGKALPKKAFVGPSMEAFKHGAVYCLPSIMQNLFHAKEPFFDPIPQETLIIWGKLDRSHRRTDKSTSLRYHPGAKMLQFEQSGHFPELEEPEQFVAALRDFQDSPSPTLM